MQSVTNPTILNIHHPAKDTELKVALPPYTRRFRIACRTDKEIKLAYRPTDIAAGIYFTIKATVPNYVEDNISSLKELYLCVAHDNLDIEIICWN